MSNADDTTSRHEFLDALREVIVSSDPATRELLAEALDAWSEDLPQDSFWAIGPQSSALLWMIMAEIDSSCRLEAQPKTRPVIRLVDTKPKH
jgi:hypothetical protein